MCLSPAVTASGQAPVDLGDLSIEDLLDLEVTSVSRRSQPLANAPAAVFVLTREDIRRSGLTSLPELLRLAPGVQVARYSNAKWSVSARGMGTYYANKLLVLIDGRSVYTPDFAGVYWEIHDIAVDDIDRIEVTRGPGGTMWGANAVNGVINIITRSAGETPGVVASVAAGSSEHAVASLRYGGSLAEDTAFRVYGRTNRTENGAAAPMPDSLHITSGGFRIDRAESIQSWMLQAEGYHGGEQTPLTQPSLRAPYSSVIDDHVDVGGVHALGRWTRTFASGSEVALKAYVDHNRRGEHIHDFASTTFDVDFQQRVLRRAGHDFMWGAGYRRTLTDITTTSDVMRYDPERSSRQLASAFAQDEMVVRPSLSLIVGTKLEYHEKVGAAIEPNVRTLWRLGDGQRLWGGVARGVRTPSLAEQIATFQYGVVEPSAATHGLPVDIRVQGDPRLEHPEALVAYEGGYRAQYSPGFALDVAVFRNQYTHLTSYARGPAAVSLAGGVPHLEITSVRTSQAAGSSYGLESLVTWTPAPRVSFSSSATLLQTNLHMTDPSVEAGNTFLVLLMSPSAQFTAHSNLQLSKAMDLDATVLWNGPWQMGNVDGYWRTDMKGSWAFGNGLSLDVGGQNLFNDRHRETSLFLYETATEIGRSGYVRFSWQL
jgi:iron complex outermembrane receptor protein